MRSGRDALRKVAVACAVMGVVAGSGAVLARPAEDTLAAWTDTESAQATVNVAWSTGGFAKNTANSYTNFNSYTARPGEVTTTDRWQRVNSSSPGTSTNDYGNTSLLGLFQNFSVLTPGLRRANRVSVCEQAAAPLSSLGNPGTNCPFADSFTSQTRASTFGTDVLLTPSYNGKGQAGFFANPSPAGNNPILWVEARGISTAAQCATDLTSKATSPTLAWPNPSGATIGLVTTGTLAPTPSDNDYVQITPQLNKIVTGWVLAKAAAGGYDTWVYYKVLMRSMSTSTGYDLPGYALSDITVQTSQYDTDSGNFLGTSELVLARSECGVSTPSSPRVPLANDWMPRNDVPTSRPTTPSTATSVADAPVPDPVTGAATFPSGFARSLQRALGEALAPLADQAATTTTTPSASATATQTTTSEPPRDPNEPTSAKNGPPTKETKATSESNSSASAIPTALPNTSTNSATIETSTSADEGAPATSAAPAIPAEPGALPADTDPCGTVEVDGEELDAVVAAGTTCDTIARRTATRALAAYIADGTKDSRWTSFTSADPATDGWRWAAIDKDTGQIVYVA